MSPTAQAGYFGTDRPRFGWLHRPERAASASGVGVVLVPPFGDEAIRAHRTFRHLALRIADAGALALRFDLDGTGDSAGDDLEPARVEHWIASVGDACDVVRSAGADRIVLVGLRLGAALAAIAASRRSDVAALCAIAGTPVGGALLRELRALQAALGLAVDPAAAAQAAGGEAAPDEFVGFAMTPETRAAIASIDLTAPPSGGAASAGHAGARDLTAPPSGGAASAGHAGARDLTAPPSGGAASAGHAGARDLVKLAALPARHVLLLDRGDRKPNTAWATALRERGAAVEQRTVAGYPEMMLDPHRAELPLEILDAAVAFVADAPALAREAPPPVTASVLSARATIGDVVEEVVQLDDCLFGIASQPASDRARTGRGVALASAGAVYRIGPNRLHVTLARRLARRGDVVLRFDQSGIGDSRPRAGAPERVTYAASGVRDVGVAVGWLRRRDARNAAVAGLCSGAYHALEAAIAGQPIHTVVSINPALFAYEPGMPLQASSSRVTQEAARYRDALRDRESWRKLLRGDVDLRHVVRIVAGRARLVAEARLRDLARRLRIPLRGDLGANLASLARRGVEVRFVFANGEPGQTLLAEGAGAVVPRLERAGALTIAVVDGADHTFTARWTHAPLLAAVERALAGP